MNKKKQRRTFSSVQEIIETYFPAYAKRQREPSMKDYSEIGNDLASELAKEFQMNLQRGSSTRPKAKH